MRVGLCKLEPKIDRISPRERSPNDLREHPKIDRKSSKNRLKISLRANRAKTTRFFCSRTRLGIDFGRRGALPGALGRPFLAFRGALGDPLGTPGGRRGRSGTLPRRSGEAFGTLLHVTGSPERIQAAILSRFWLPQGVSGDRSSVDFRCVF